MRLNEGGTLAAMFDEVERQLRDRGIQARPAKDALVKAGIVKGKGGSKPQQGATLGATQKT